MTRSRKRFLASSAAAAAFGIVSSPARAAQFQYKIAYDLASSHPIGVGVTQFAAAVNRESGGRLEIRVFPEYALGGSTSLVTQLRTGALEMLMQGAAPWAAIAPVINIGFIGFAFSKSEPALAAMQGDLGAIFRKELEAKNIHVMEKLWEAGMRQITTSGKVIHNADDLAGLKVRIPLSPITVDLFKTLGAAPLGMNLDQLYPALQTHIVDAADGPYINLFAQRIYEVQSVISVTNHQWSGYWFTIGGDAWRALPPDLQAVVTRNANKYATQEQRVAFLQNASTGDTLVRHGMKRNVADTATMTSRLGGYYDRWKKEFGPTVWSAMEKYSGKLG